MESARNGPGFTFACPIREDFPLTVLSPTGSLTALTAPTIRMAVAKAVSSQPDLVMIDVSAMQVGDEIALSIFPALARRADAAGTSLRLVSASPDLAAALDRMAVCRYVQTHPSMVTALAAHAAQPTPKRVHALLAPLPSAPATARNLVDRSCTAWAVSRIADAAALATTELVANAVEHAGTQIWFSVVLRGGHLHLAVRDNNVVPPRLRTPDLDGGGGRGLLIVDSLCSSWGSAPTCSGKVVWATLRLHPPADTSRRS